MLGWFSSAEMRASLTNISMQLRVVRLVLVDALDHEDALEPLDPVGDGPEDLGHPAAPDALEQEEAAELLPRRGVRRRSRFQHLLPEHRQVEAAD